MISICIASFGDDRWRELAWSRAYPSAAGQGDYEVIVEHQPDGTCASARNAAAAEANGDWLIFLDADDELAPGFVDAMRTCANGTGEMLVPRVQYVRAGRRSQPKYWPEMSLRDGSWLVIGTMVPRQKFREVGGFTEHVHLYEDWMLFAQLWKAGLEPVKVPQAVYVAHQQRRGRNSQASHAERFYWHQWIGHQVFPERYAPTTAAEDAEHKLHGDPGRQPRSLRFV